MTEAFALRTSRGRRSHRWRSSPSASRFIVPRLTNLRLIFFIIHYIICRDSGKTVILTAQSRLYQALAQIRKGFAE